eukprot:117939_1
MDVALDSADETTLITKQSHSHKCTKKRWIVIFSLLMCIIASVVGVILIIEYAFIDESTNDITYIYRGSEMLKLLSTNTNIINDEIFAIPLTEYNDPSLNALYLSIRNKNILSILNINRSINGNYPNLDNNKCKLLLYNISFTATNNELQQLIQSMFDDITINAYEYYNIHFNLTRFDLFHGHIFYNNDSNTAGILFHALEYPKMDESFPYHLGYCQQNSTAIYNEYFFSYRNILLLMHMDAYVLKSNIWLLNTKNGSYIQQNVMQPYALTVFVDDIGQEIGEIYYFNDTKLLWQTFKPI